MQPSRLFLSLERGLCLKLLKHHLEMAQSWQNVTVFLKCVQTLENLSESKNEDIKTACAAVSYALNWARLYNNCSIETAKSFVEENLGPEAPFENLVTFQFLSDLCREMLPAAETEAQRAAAAAAAPPGQQQGNHLVLKGACFQSYASVRAPARPDPRHFPGPKPSAFLLSAPCQSEPRGPSGTSGPIRQHVRRIALVNVGIS